MKEKQSVPKVLLAPLLQNYFCSHLIGQRDLSRRTISPAALADAAMANAFLAEESKAASVRSKFSL